MKNYLLIFILFFVAVSITGCASKVNKYWMASGGSRADAVIEIAFSYNPEEEIPVVSDIQGQQIAEERCQTWGYHSAHPFGMTKRVCQQQDYNPWNGTYDCADMLVTKEYQCIEREDSRGKGSDG